MEDPVNRMFYSSQKYTKFLDFRILQVCLGFGVVPGDAGKIGLLPLSTALAVKIHLCGVSAISMGTLPLVDLPGTRYHT